MVAPTWLRRTPGIPVVAGLATYLGGLLGALKVRCSSGLERWGSWSVQEILNNQLFAMFPLSSQEGLVFLGQPRFGRDKCERGCGDVRRLPLRLFNLLRWVGERAAEVSNLVIEMNH
jgi:hypothetical protein